MGSQHWLVAAARRGGLEPGESLSIPGSMPLAEAWAAVATAANCSDEVVGEAVARAFHIQPADLSSSDAHSRRLVPTDVARRFGVYPLRDDNIHIWVATAEPINVEAEQALGFCSGRTPVFEVAPPAALQQAVESAYAPERAVESFLRSSELPAEKGGEGVRLLEVDEAEEEVAVEDLGTGPVVRLANLILRDAVEHRASDIHIQPNPSGGVVRFRVDGVLRTVLQFPLAVLLRVVSRLKVMGKLDIADRLRPQDGRFRVAVQGRPYDFRLSTVPVRGAEKAVVRILDTGGTRSLDELDMSSNEEARFRRLLMFREGIVAVTGPTGSGKTTTLYAAIKEIATEDVNIMTVEDPVEYELPGIAQIQVETKQNVTFASALRAILRQDPDVIFVGEIRDEETAEMAVQASLTGHLVLTTLHTNDALASVRRLYDLGVEMPAIVQSFRGALAQRLVRRICTECAEPLDQAAVLSEEEQALRMKYGVRPSFRPVGCAACGHTGYRGRVLVNEVFLMTPEVQELLLHDASPRELLAATRADGMRTMREMALDHVRAGITTLQELERVLGDLDEAPSAPQAEPTKAAEETAKAVPASPPPVPDADDELVARVLVVDDDGATRTIARAVLEKDGFHVGEAADGAQAVQILELARDYHLVVLDLSMPNMDGREVLEWVRRNPATHATPVIVLTGSQDADAEAQLMDAGADDYIHKPLDPARFLARVRATLRRVGATVA